MICSAECRFRAMISCLPNTPILREYSHKKWTRIWGSGQFGYDINNHKKAAYALGFTRPDGSVGFEFYGPFDMKSQYHALAAGDLDGNGWPEVITRRSSNGDTAVRIAWVEDGEVSHLTDESAHSSSYSPDSSFHEDERVSVRAADIDGDGKSDLVLNTSNSLILVRWSSRQSFTRYQHYEIPELPRENALYEPRDYDGDGDVDILVFDTESYKFTLIEGTGEDLILSHTQLPRSYIALPFDSSIWFGLFDDDPAIDLIYSNRDSDTLQIESNFTNTNTQTSTIPLIENQYLSGVLGDINDSGFDDVILSAPAPNPGHFGHAREHVLLSDPLQPESARTVIEVGNFQGRYIYDGINFNEIRVGMSVLEDFNGDQLKDILWFGPLIDRTVSQVSPQRECLQGLPMFGATRLDANRYPVHILPVDLNGDGIPELVQSGTSTTTILDTVTGVASEVAGVGGGFMSELADLENDGRPEIVISNVDKDIAILQVQEDGSIGSISTISSPINERLFSVVVDDFDSDEHDDIAAFESVDGTATVYIYRGINSGSVELWTTIEDIPSSAVKAASLDFNNDGLPDFAIGLQQLDQIALYVNAGNGSFDLVLEIPTPSPYWIISEDIDSDGVVDLVSVDRSKTITIHFMNADGAVHESRTLSENIGSRELIEVVAIDFNSDSLLDLGTALYSNLATHTPNRHIIWKQVSAREFEPTAVLPAPYGTSVAVADMNIDGAVDLITASFNDSSVRIHWAEPPSCPADFNCDGDLNFLDISQFLVSFASGDLVADLVADGTLNFLDVSEFISVFGKGCQK